MTAISIKNAIIGYSEDYKLFENFSIDINKGEYVSILGKTGIGKTTILKSLIGLNSLISGQINVNGSIAICFQDSRLFPHMNVYNNILYPLTVKKKYEFDIHKKVDDILKRMDIYDLKDKNVNKLSGGEIKRVALARALVTEPDILLLDEPTSNLDFSVKMSIRELIRNIHKNTKCTVVMVTHDIFDALYLSDKILLLEEKKVIKYVDRDKIRDDEEAKKYFEPFIEELKRIII